MLTRLLRELFGARSRPKWRQPDTGDSGGGGITLVAGPPHGFVAVVGESRYQEALRTLAAHLGQGDDRVFMATLVPEPTNPYDPNAVAVTTESGAKVGYLSREVAKSYHKRLARQGSPVTCPAKLVGGKGRKRSIGVVLGFEEVNRC